MNIYDITNNRSTEKVQKKKIKKNLVSSIYEFDSHKLVCFFITHKPSQSEITKS